VGIFLLRVVGVTDEYRVAALHALLKNGEELAYRSTYQFRRGVLSIYTIYIRVSPVIKDELKIIDWLLSGQGRGAAFSSLGDWERLCTDAFTPWEMTIDRAIAGGFLADRLSYAFAAGFRTALGCLIPAIPMNRFIALCVTEENGGGHPRSIRTSIERVQSDTGEGWRLNGRKKYITMADEAELLLVAASSGFSHGHNQVQVVIIERDSSGVTVEPMELPILPEISHGVIRLDNVEVQESHFLPGDGYLEYVKPFRTIEDLHVNAAVLGYLFRLSSDYNWAQLVREQMLAIITAVRTLAGADPLAYQVHIALGGLHRQMEHLLELISPYWKEVDEKTRSGWMRDSALLQVAGSARARRLERAWEHYTLSEDNAGNA
jgi:acyl-CoA dehydrogenase